MDEDECSARLLKVIADRLGVPIEQFTNNITGPANASDIERVLNHQDVSNQVRHLLRLYRSLPDQSSKDTAVKMIERFAEEHGKD